jgi:hypothetical protein
LFNIIHVTHEAVYKVGGIGTVLEGLINSRPYRDEVGRTLLVCPMFYPENPVRFGPGGIIEYSSLDHVNDSVYSEAFRRVERDFNVRIAYGQRPVEDVATTRRTLCEVLLIDLRGIDRDRVNELKGVLWRHYSLQSHRYEHIWDFEQYVQLAAPAAAALAALQMGTDEQPAVVLAHEYMGVPTALALAAYEPRRYRTIFHAHEVATIRRIVEEHPGHDVMFYSVLEAAREARLYLGDVFGPQHDYYKHAIVEATPFCDATLAVGPLVVRELQFLGNNFEQADISLAYNGISATRIAPEQRAASREHLRDYCQALLDWRPDHVFTHVTRLVVSKALWRDFDVLAALDAEFVRQNRTAALIVLSTEGPRRSVEDVLRMEEEWDWPLAHREGYPDLLPGEARFYQGVQAINARLRNIHVIYINQFGFSAEECGRRVPPAVSFIDLRRGSDVEFGLSLYEPFGISPLETLTFGGICVTSTSCGCAGLLRQAMGPGGSPNVVLADYIHGAGQRLSIKAALDIDRRRRREAEQAVARSVAAELLQRLPTTPADHERLLESGYALASRMSWDAVTERMVLPTLRRACARRRILRAG